MSHPDVVVIGAGLGGLACAARLAMAGVRVLVLEGHDRPGGYASSFRRGNHVFEVSLHLMDAVGPDEPNHALLRETGVGALELRKPSVLRRERWPDVDVRVPWGPEPYLEHLRGLFPHERHGIASLFDLARRAHESRSDPNRGELAELARTTMGRVVDAHVGDRRLRGMLELFGHGWMGLPLDELASLQFLVPWYSYHAFGGYYPVGGSARLAEALCDVVRARGGEVSFSTPARRIVVERRRACGVELADGSYVPARAVVSNASPEVTFGQLLPSVDLEPRYRARLERMPRSVSCAKMWIGLRDRELLGACEYDTYLASYDPPRADRVDPDGCTLSMVVPSAIGADLCGARASAVSISSLVTPEAWDACGSDEPARRARVIDRLLERVEECLVPGLAAAAEVIEVATPRTFERFTANPSGCIYGASAHVGWCGGTRLGAVTPIGALYLAGAWTRPGHGVTSVMQSGLWAAREVERRLAGRRAAA